MDAITPRGIPVELRIVSGSPDALAAPPAASLRPLFERKGPAPVQAPHQANPLIDKLGRFASLGTDDEAAIRHLCRQRRSMTAGATLVHEDARLSVVFVVLAGVAYRYRMLPNGRRQIFGYLLPGDLGDADFILSDRCDHTICLLTDCEVAVVPIAELVSVLARAPRVAHALMLAGQSEGAVLRSWLLNVGQRPALQRIAHFLCEMSAQLYAGDRVTSSALPMPLTQHELADTVGLTVVHANRCLRRLRDGGVIAWGRKRVTILDRARLMRIAGLDQPCSKVAEPAEMTGSWSFARGGV